MKKTVLEWLNEVKILEKRVGKKESELIKNLYSISLDYKKDETYKADEVKSDYQSLIKLKDNLDKIKNAIMVYNATTQIVVGDKTMSIAYALNKYTKSNLYFEEDIKNKASKFIKEIENVKTQSQKEKADLDKQLLTKNNISEKDKALLEVTKSKYDIIIVDPLNIVELANKLFEDKEIFNNEVNNKINLSNALTSLEINLD